jgi:hypothetical protein
VGHPAALFEPGIPGGGFALAFNKHLDVTKDGRFLIPVALTDAGARPLIVVLNWTRW